MTIKLKLFIFLFAVVYINAEYVNYKNYKVYSIKPETENDVKLLKEVKNENEFMFWMDVGILGQDVRIMVHPEKQEKFEKYMISLGLKAVLFIDDVQRLIDEQVKRPTVARNIKKYDWTYYQSLEEVYVWMDKIATEFSNVVTIEEIGISVENRTIKGIKIDYKKKENPVIGMFEGTLHAREWITTATLTWIVNEFLTSRDERVRFLAENIVWHVFPITNPDGYKYSFTDNRMWRKNRSKDNFKSCGPGTNDDLSNGVDLNRNFGYLWNTMGASSNPCDETFAGPIAFSEPEATAIGNHIMKLKKEGNLMYYFSMHSFSQMILVPYSHVGGADVLQVPNYADMFEIAIKGAEKLTKRHNTSYRVGTSLDILYPVTGSGFDWVKGVAEVPLVFLYELRDVGPYGFLLPPEQIIPNSEEVMDSLIEMDKVARQMGYYSDGCAFKISATLLAVALMFSLRV